jgi:hypothetical protein
VRADLERDGFAVLEESLPVQRVDALCRVVDRLARERGAAILNEPDVFGLDPLFLELLDAPAALAIATELLGANLWINSSHANLNRPGSRLTEGDAMGWHRDGGRILEDLSGAPRMAVKMAYYLTDLSEGDAGETLVIPGSHRPDFVLPGKGADRLALAAPLRVPAGSLVVYDSRVVHTLATPNRSARTRIAIFVQYAFRWLFPVGEPRLRTLPAGLSPVRAQLLGAGTHYRDRQSAARRSSRYFPAKADLPLELLGPARPEPMPLRRRLRLALALLRGR